MDTSCYNMLVVYVYNSFFTKQREKEHETWSKYEVYQEEYSTRIIKNSLTFGVAVIVSQIP